MDQKHNESHSYNNLITNKSSSWLEVRLFYVRITPCVIESVPGHLTLRHLGRSISNPLEINGSKIPGADSAFLNLRRDRLNKESSEVTYVSTDSVRVTCGVEFEVLDNKDMVLCGSLERIETTSWGNNGSVGRLENDAKTGWCLECCVATGVFEGKSVFKLGVSAPVIEVYIVGCCRGVPVILTKTVLVSPRKKASRYAILDAIPEDEELDNRRQNDVISNGLVRQRKVQITEAEGDDGYDSDEKIGNRYYSGDMYYGEDGQLSWFNAGVRVGVGIGLGMCLGVGIGVGLLMRSYRATNRNFRKSFP